MFIVPRTATKTKIGGNGEMAGKGGGWDGGIFCVLFTYKPLKCVCMYIGFAKLMGFCHVLLLIVHIAI